MRYRLSTLLIIVSLIALACPLLLWQMKLRAFGNELRKIGLELVESHDDRTHLVRDTRLGREFTLHVYPDTEHFQNAVRMLASQDHPNIPMAVNAGTIAGGQGFLLTSIVPNQRMTRTEFEDRLVQSTCSDVGRHLRLQGIPVPIFTYRDLRMRSDGRFLIAPETWLQNDMAR